MTDVELLRTTSTIKHMKQLAEDNSSVADDLEANKSPICQSMPEERVENLIRIYRYWSRCLLVSAWLLESEFKNEPDIPD